MAILVNRDTRVLIQGVTGRSGTQVTGELLDYGMRVLAGVTPGKGGQEIEAVPVFNSIKEAVEQIGPVDVSMVYVPPLLAYEAAIEAIEAQIPLKISHLSKEDWQTFSPRKFRFLILAEFFRWPLKKTSGF